MHREYLRLAKNLHKVCVNMSSRQSGIYTPKLNISDDKTIQEFKNNYGLFSLPEGPLYAAGYEIEKLESGKKNF